MLHCLAANHLRFSVVEQLRCRPRVACGSASCRPTRACLTPHPCLRLLLPQEWGGYSRYDPLGSALHDWAESPAGGVPTGVSRYGARLQRMRRLWLGWHLGLSARSLKPAGRHGWHAALLQCPFSTAEARPTPCLLI